MVKARIAYGRIAYGRIAYGRITYGRIAYGRIAYGRIAYGRIAYGCESGGYASGSLSATVAIIESLEALRKTLLYKLSTLATQCSMPVWHISSMLFSKSVARMRVHIRLDSLRAIIR